MKFMTVFARTVAESRYGRKPWKGKLTEGEESWLQTSRERERKRERERETERQRDRDN